LIDPEGDFRGMQVLPGIVALEGNRATLPSPAVVAALLETMTISAVLDLCAYPVSYRDQYVVDLLRALRPLKERKFRPHWIVIEEAQHFLSSEVNATLAPLLPMLAGGWAFFLYSLDWLASAVLGALNQTLLTRLSPPKAVQAVREALLKRMTTHYQELQAML
jgi:hypothetical protein